MRPHALLFGIALPYIGINIVSSAQAQEIEESVYEEPTLDQEQPTIFIDTKNSVEAILSSTTGVLETNVDEIAYNNSSNKITNSEQSRYVIKTPSTVINSCISTVDENSAFYASDVADLKVSSTAFSSVESSPTSETVSSSSVGLGGISVSNLSVTSTDITQQLPEAPQKEKKERIERLSLKTGSVHEAGQGDSAIKTAKTPDNFVSFEDWKNKKLQDEIEDKQMRKVLDSEHYQDQPDNDDGAIGEEMELDFDYLRSSGSGGDSSAKKASPIYVEEEGKIYKKKFNFASLDCAATIVASNKEAQSAMSILQENKDRSLLFPCNLQTSKFVVIELCEDILVEEIEIANFEFFSSTFKKFKVMVSDRYPVIKQKLAGKKNCTCDPLLQELTADDSGSGIPGGAAVDEDCCSGGWRVLGEFEADDTMTVQKFQILQPQIWAKYLRVEILSHYGDEFYCPISVLRVHGKTMMEEFKQEEHTHFEEQQKAQQQQNERQAEQMQQNLHENEVSAHNDLDEEDLFISNNLLLQYQANVFATKVSANDGEESERNVCVAELPYVKFDDFVKEKEKEVDTVTQKLQQQQQQQQLHRGSSEESIFKNMVKRLSVLESNATLSILYLETQSKMLSQSFSKLETKYASIMEEVVSSINSTMTSNIEIMNSIVESIRLSNEILIEKEMDMMNNEIGYRLNELKKFESEMFFVKNMMYGIIIISVFSLVYVLVTREAYLMSHLEREESDSWYDNNGRASPFIKANKKLWGRIMTPPLTKKYHSAQANGEAPAATPSSAERPGSISSVSSNSSDQFDSADVVSVGSDINM